VRGSTVFYIDAVCDFCVRTWIRWNFMAYLSHRKEYLLSSNAHESFLCPCPGYTILFTGTNKIVHIGVAEVH